MRRKRSLHGLADEELILLAARGEIAAFELIYERHSGAAYSLAHRILGSPTAAEDVTQEAFLSIWRSEARFDRARGSVRAWIYATVRNRAIDAIRRESAKRKPLLAPLELGEQGVPDPRGDAHPTESEALRRETARELGSALGRLPPDQSRVLELAYFSGFSQSEIAQLLGVPLGTVKGRMRLALEKIRSELAEEIR